MSVKFKLYATESGWNNKHAAVMTELELPSGSTERYAEISQVTNSEHADAGKFIFPVKTDGVYKCDQLFNSSDLVDADPEWTGS
tara:strand:- start:120 stop:371 length:252 start_codon:yes stop_codon:yes gene_type:complete